MMNGMVFRRRFQNLRPIHSIKNIVQDVAIIAAAGVRSQLIINTVETPALADTDGVKAGARINTIYIECWLYGNAVAGVNSPVTWFIGKSPGGNLTLPDPAVQGTDDNKKWIFASGKGLLGGTATGQPGYLIRGWFSIPKKMRRFGFNDQLFLRVKNDTANDINFCFMAIYKWYE